MLENIFHLKENRTDVKTEIMAGITTFMTMAYILAVNPNILSASGMDSEAVLIATALASFVGTALMALLANYPFALAPGMGLNAFFAFSICGSMGYSWQAALAAVFISGCLFIIITVTGVREAIVRAIPMELKSAISVGIGFFIAFIGLKNANMLKFTIDPGKYQNFDGTIVADASPVPAFNFASASTLLAIFGLIVLAVLYVRNVKGALFIGILVTSAVGCVLQFVFGIDVGGTSVKCGLFQTDGTLLEKWEIPTRTENGGSEILPDIAKSVKAKMAEKGIAADDVAGVGIDVPGPVNDKGELSIAVNLNWGYKNIVKELSDELGGMAVKAANDANAAALGEMWAGGGKGSKNLVMVTLGTGVGGGIIVDGKIVAGAHGAGGEVGHACVEPEEEAVCNCGNHGCLEQMTSATGIVRLAKKYLASHDTPSSLRERGESISAKAVFDALKEGDAAAEAIVQEFSEYLGRALAVFACVVDPEVIVVGGGVSKAGQILIDGVAKYYREAAFIACKDTPIVLASLGNDAGIYGAAKMLID